jgi:hypothetical protein
LARCDVDQNGNTPGLDDLRVECYAGYRGEETPRRLWIGERCVEVQEVLDRWLAPDHRYFKLRGDDLATYIVRHDEGSGRWTLQVYESGR